MITSISYKHSLLYQINRCKQKVSNSITYLGYTLGLASKNKFKLCTTHINHSC